MPSQPIRIAVDARPLSAPLSGVARVISRVIQFFPEPDRFVFCLFSHRPAHPDFADILALPNVEWHTGTGVSAKLGGLWYNLTLPRILRREPVHLFWGSQQVIPPNLPGALPVVLTYYDLVLYFFPQAMRRLARWQQRAVQGLSVRRASRILSISKQTEDDMIARFGYPPQHARVAHLGYDAPVGQLSPGFELPEKPFILSVSTIEPRKNYGMLLQAYEDYLNKSEGEPYDLVVAGRRGWESPEFFARLDELIERTGRIRVIENASDADLAALYKGCRFFCMPTLYEGFGLPLLEALANGAPAIASDLGCLREIGGDRIRYVPATDAQAWSRALLECVRMDGAGRLPRVKFPVDEWSWEKTARVHWAAFTELL